MVFTGVELGDAPSPSTTLEEKIVTLPKYAYYKHIGSYNLIRQSYTNMAGKIKTRGLNACLPYIEIYGHWDNDESRLETELLMCIK
jgi:effector-binding domain-containing protein